MARTLPAQALVGGAIQLLLFPLVLFLAAGDSRLARRVDLFAPVLQLRCRYRSPAV